MGLTSYPAISSQVMPAHLATLRLTFGVVFSIFNCAFALLKAVIFFRLPTQRLIAPGQRIEVLHEGAKLFSRPEYITWIRQKPDFG